MSRRHNFSGTEFTDRGEGIPRKKTSGMASGQQSLGINPNTYLSKQSTRTPTSQQYQTESQYMYRGSDYRKEQPVGTANRPHDFESDLYPKQTGKNITQRRKDTIANSDELIAQLLSENEKLKARLEEEKTMKQEALSRLSQIAGNKLKDGNSAIADLADANRPSKLAEKISSLYTEEWVEAFEKLKLQPDYRKKDGEGKICKLLLNIFVTCFNTCKEIAEKQLYQVKLMSWNLTVVLHLDEVEGNPSDPSLRAGSVMVSPNRESIPSFDGPVSGARSVNLKNNLGKTIKGGNMNILPYDHTIHEDIIHQGKEKRKQINPYVIDKIKCKCLEKIKKTINIKFDKDLQIFTYKCAELSWLMNVQDPPMSILSYLDPGSPISKELRQYFTLYNTSSEVVDHVVWPAVLLQENGAIISKGVIQGK